ncbi:MAG: hypothetical protein RL385_4193, partial [Pseudomonadota bacterium]
LETGEHGFVFAGAAGRQRAVRETCERVQAHRVGDSLVVRLHFHDTDAERALAFADRLANLYVQRSSRSGLETADRWQGMRSELESREASLVVSENALRDYLKLTGGANRTELQARLDAELSAYNAALTDLRIRKARHEAKVAARSVASLTKRSGADLAGEAKWHAEHDGGSNGFAPGPTPVGNSAPMDVLRADPGLAQLDGKALSTAALEDLRAQARALEMEERELLRRRDACAKEGMEMLGAGIELGRLERAVQAREAERNGALRQLQQSWGARDAREPVRALGPPYLQEDFAADAARWVLPGMLFLAGALILRRPRAPVPSVAASHRTPDRQPDLSGRT